MLRAVESLLLLVAAQSPQVATPPAPAPANIEKKAAPKQPKLICKRVPVIGSNVGSERVCVSREESRKMSGDVPKDTKDPQGGRETGNGN